MDDYECRCVRCGSALNLKMMPCINQNGSSVGWIFSCPKCDETVRKMDFCLANPATEKDEKEGD